MSRFRIRVVIVDDSRSFMGALRNLVHSAGWLDLVGTARTAEEALHLLGDFHVDLVLMDIQLPGMDGIEATRRIRSAYPNTRVVVMTMMSSDEYETSAYQAGAHGFIRKSEAGRSLLPAIERIFKEERESL